MNTLCFNNYKMQQKQIGLNWVELGWIGMNWVALGWIELGGGIVFGGGNFFWHFVSHFFIFAGEIKIEKK